MSNVKYIGSFIGKIITDIKEEKVDGSVFSEFKVESQNKYENSILNTLEAWHA